MDLNMIMDSQGGIPIGFFSVEDLIAMTGWSKGTVLKLFDDPKFPSADFGRRQIIEAHALVDYFSVSRRKSVTARDMKECYRKADEFMKKQDFINNGGDPDKTIPGILKESYDKDLKMGFVGEQGYCRNLSNLKVLEKTDIGSKPIRNFTKDEVRDCFNTLGKKYSNSLIKQFFRSYLVFCLVLTHAVC